MKGFNFALKVLLAVSILSLAGCRLMFADSTCIGIGCPCDNLMIPMCQG